jgi:hypothetical protein
LHRIHRMSGLLPPNVAARVIVLTSKFKLQWKGTFGYKKTKCPFI